MATFTVSVDVEAESETEAWAIAARIMPAQENEPRLKCISVVQAATVERANMMWSVNVRATTCGDQCELMLAYDGREERMVVSAYKPVPSAEWGDVGVRSFYVTPEHVAMALRAMHHWPLDLIDKHARAHELTRARSLGGGRKR